MALRPSFIALSKSKSAKAWLARQFQDPYVKQRLSGPQAYRARSAFKLVEIDSQYYHFLTKPDVKAVIDLGAAPGGWSQVVAGKLGWDESRPREDATSTADVGREDESKATCDYEPSADMPWSSMTRVPARRSRRKVQSELLTFDPLNIDSVDTNAPVTGRGTIVALDLLRMQPIHGVHCIQADFLSPEAERLIHGLLSVKGNPEGKVDVILSDMAANSSGNQARDIESSLVICQSVVEFARRNLRTAEDIGRRRGGVLLMKYFTHPLLQDFYRKKLRPNFHDVKSVKPPSSRGDSNESYFLCQGWKGDH